MASPLRGPGGFSNAIGMARSDTAAGFIRVKIPYLVTANKLLLSLQRARVVVAYMLALPRSGFGPWRGAVIARWYNMWITHDSPALNLESYYKSIY